LAKNEKISNFGLTVFGDNYVEYTIKQYEEGENGL
jgi:hypothetical protein